MATIDLAQLAQKHGEFLCPSALYGSTPETKMKWRKVVKAAWATRDWQFVGNLEMSDIRRSDTGIILENDCGYKWSTERRRWSLNSLYEVHRLTGERRLWHLNWVLEIQPLSFEGQRSCHEEHLRFVLSGMKYPWYAIGFFGFGGLYTHNIVKIEERESVCVVLRKKIEILHWVLTIYDRLYRNRVGIMGPYKGNCLLTFLLSNLWGIGLLPQPVFDDILNLDLENTIARLIELELIRFDGLTFTPLF